MRTPYDAWVLSRTEVEGLEEQHQAELEMLEKLEVERLTYEPVEIALDAVMDSSDPEVQQWALALLSAMGVVPGPVKQYPTRPRAKWSSSAWSEKSCSNAVVAKWTSRSRAGYWPTPASASGHFTGLSYAIRRRFPGVSQAFVADVRHGGHIE